MNIVPNRWYAILDPSEVPTKSPVARRRLGKNLVFWRDASGQICAAEDRCPHRGAALSGGTVEQGCITCPFHGFRFTPKGECDRVPAHPGKKISQKLRLETLELREAHDLLWAWTGPQPAPDQAPPFFDALGEMSWRGSQLLVPMDVHYTRTIENQLDFAHLAFVHKGSIGRLAQPEVEVDVRMEGDHLYASVRDEDNAQAPIELIGPNIWMLPISPGKVHGFAAYVPVDEEHTVTYFRMYQAVMRIPGISSLFGRMSALFNRRVIMEDAAVVRTQVPKHSSLRNGEVYVPSDRPIIEYLRWREQLIEQAGAPALSEVA